MRTSSRRLSTIASTMTVAALAGVVTSTAMGGSSGTTTCVETFDDGMNHTEWTWDRTPFGSIEPANGVPDTGGFFKSELMAVPSLFTTHPTFTGNFRERGVSSIGGDLRGVQFASQAGVISIALVHFNGTPDDLLDSTIAHLVTTIPSPTNPDFGWVSFDLEIPSDSQTLPEGWALTGAFPVWEPGVDWNTLITNVDEVLISWHSTLEFVLLFDVIRGADNLRITYNGEPSGPPTYTATILPQLDTTDDPFALTFTSPFDINDSRWVTGDVGTGLGFVWAPKTGGTLLQPQFPSVADAAVGTGLNAAGDVCGSYRPTGTFVMKPFHYSSGGAFTGLPTLAANLAGGAADVNDAGMVVGSVETAPGGTFGGPTTAVYWLNGDLSQIGDLGGSTAYAAAVNNQGVVIGAANTNTALALQPFRWTQKGGMEVLPQLVPGVPATPADINDAGVIVGRGGISLFANEPVFWDADGNIHQLPRLDPQPADVGVLGINNDDVMVGFELTSDVWEFEARLWLNGDVYRLQDLVEDLEPGIKLLRATGVNNNGDIVVEASTQVDDAVQFITVILTPDSIQPPCGQSDLNCDGAIDVSDLLILLAEWGPCPQSGACPADLNDDGTVDVSDLLLLLADWG